MNNISRYPLSWPQGWKRTPPDQRKTARFATSERHYSNGGSWQRKSDLTVSEAVRRIQIELERIGVRSINDIVISTNIETRLDGTPRSGQREPADPGVCVYWTDGCSALLAWVLV